ncbi:hypothetical protein [Azotobacter beijerinckii]|uniref:hypothetical protein n=1 Tax=Azotobacter beijerinckii TaxID=170623 RepID=UPI00111332E8|nr:hypothetical protein [Azotobacter beijerinckii]
MSDWEEFCESKGLNIGSEDDYNKLLNSLEDSLKKLSSPFFKTFEEAKYWAKENIGKSFIRSPDGSGFVPKNRGF